MYSLPAYGRMVADSARFGAYREALLRAISPGDVVADLGAGPGVFSLLAAKAGAQKVYAIETDATLEWLRSLAVANGVEDQIILLRQDSATVNLPEKIDVLISDLRGVLPFFGFNIPSVIDARERWLKLDGRLLAAKDRLWASPVKAGDLYARQVSGFEGIAFAGVDCEEGDLDLSALAEAASQHWCRAEFASEACLGDPALLGAVDYRQVSSPHFSGQASWTLDRDGLSHGLGVWFDGQIDETISFSNRPGGEVPLYGQAFFPWRRPWPLSRGDRLEIEFDARLVGDDYVFRWQGRQRREVTGDGKSGHFLTVREEDQSTFFGAPLGLIDVRS